MSALVSFIMPVYNAELFLSETIKCIINQTYKDWELIICDDGSSDHSLKIAKGFECNQVKVFSNKNKGASASRNYGLKQSEGKLIIFFDADDLIPANFVEEQVNTYQANEGSVILAQWGRFYDNDLKTFIVTSSQTEAYDLKKWVQTHWKQADPMTNPGRALIPRQIVEHAGPWDESLSLYDDMEFFTRIFAQSKNIVLNKDSTFYYRSGVSGLSSSKSISAYVSMYNSINQSINTALIHCPEKDVRLPCANMLQVFIYEVYPMCPELVAKASQRIKKLGGSDLKYPAGGVTKKLLHFFHWKAVKRLKNASIRIQGLVKNEV